VVAGTFVDFTSITGAIRNGMWSSEEGMEVTSQNEFNFVYRHLIDFMT